MKEKIKGKKIERINLIPILDAIFIFIFFLLLSTEFVQLGEMAIKIDEKRALKESSGNGYKNRLDLILMKNKIILKMSYKDKREKVTIITDTKYKYLENLKSKLISFKKKVPSERTIKVWPSDKVSYETVLKVVETSKFFYNQGENKKKALFDLVTLGNLQGGFQ